VGSAVYVTNPNAQVAGTWVDPSAVPSKLGTSSIAGEASRAVAHFGYDANADYMIFTPTGHSTTGFGTQFCAWHSSTSSSSGPVSFSNMPYQPDAGAACGMNFVNPANDPSGHGYFDGFSIVGGHEYAETVTDPFPSSGWVDAAGAENGDKCAWISSGSGASTNITLSTGFYAVQSLWSNASNGCVTSYP
jgi:serine protease